MTIKETFKGKNHRVQLTAIDLTGKDVSESVRKDKPIFMVHVLPKNAHPYTAFCRGEQVYYGSNFKLAFAHVIAWLEQEIKVPKNYKKYEFLKLDEK